MLTAVAQYLLTAVVMAFVLWPLVRARRAETADEPETLSPLEKQKLDAYAAIKEAEFDRRMGKLSEADFEEQTLRYRQQALAAIAALEKSRRRGGKQAAPPAAAAPVRMYFCPSCGHRLVPAANFCSSCGRALREAVA
jgi:cytochrome c-type biogenesis protein CcmH/NrfG